MAEYMYLQGSEDVMRAASNMSGAAEQMNRAALNIVGAVDQFERLIERFEAAVERLVSDGSNV